MTKKNL